jgi:DNA-binding MarR family transcriptional regulator
MPLRPWSEYTAAKTAAACRRPAWCAHGQLALARAMYDDRGKRRYTVAQIAEEFGVTRPTIYRHLDRVPPQAPPPAA